MRWLRLDRTVSIASRGAGYRYRFDANALWLVRLGGAAIMGPTARLEEHAADDAPFGRVRR